MPNHKRHRNTRQRRVILEELKKVTTHPTASVLYEFVRRRLPRISLGTVYRNLELLTRLGLIQKLDVQGGEARFDGNPDAHYHVRCIHCGRVDDVHDLADDPVRSEFTTLNGYEILGHRFEFFGICPACKRLQTSEDQDPASG
jgi:Fur family ferric uptake transcriptional regulator